MGTMKLCAHHSSSPRPLPDKQMVAESRMRLPVELRWLGVGTGKIEGGRITESIPTLLGATVVTFELVCGHPPSLNSESCVADP